MAVTPPSIKKSAPTTYAESSDARYTASFAISNGSAIRLLGLLVPRTPLTALPWFGECGVEVPDVAFDGGEQGAEVGNIPNVRATGETSGFKFCLCRLHRPLIQPEDGDARALSVEFLRCGHPDSAITAGDED